MFKVKRAICSLAASIALFSVVPNNCNAEYITAFEEIKYEKYVVDTDSFFYPNEKDKNSQFNCIVWKYTSAEDKGSPFAFKFKFENNKWYIHERNKKNELEWVDVDPTSIAAGVLRVALPYIGHSALDRKEKTES